MKPPVNIELGASARASISIKGEVPKHSLGRLVDSFVDIFRPFSESRGLAADQVRLQREDVAIEIAKRARTRLSIEQAEINPVDSKILIPLIEKSSLEEPTDDEMIERWSALLANASAAREVEPRYIQILSEMTARQALLFEKVMLNNEERFYPPEQYFEDAPILFNSSQIREQISSLLRDRKTRMDPEELTQTVFNMVYQPGCAAMDVILFEPNDHMWSIDYSIWQDRYDKIELDLEIISSLGLLRKNNIFYLTKFKEDIQIIYHHATELGVGFFNSVDKRKREKG